MRGGSFLDWFRMGNYIGIVFLFIIGILIIWKRFIAIQNYAVSEQALVNDFDLEHLERDIKLAMQKILRQRPEELNLNKTETEKRLSSKSRLRCSLKKAPTGDEGAKNYLLDFIASLLERNYGINRETIDFVIPFTQMEELKNRDKWAIILHNRVKKDKKQALENIIEEEHWAQERKEQEVRVTKEQLSVLFNKEISNTSFSYAEKLAILSQRIYEDIWGHSVVDFMLDLKIDGISGGVSGIPSDMYVYTDDLMSEDFKNLPFSYDSIWCMYHGISVHLDFLSFGNQKELERVCRNIYRHNNPGQLSSQKGFIVNDRKDGSRVVVTRPPLSDSWLFLVRKHMNSSLQSIYEMGNRWGEKGELPVYVLQSIIKGLKTFGITGGQGCGKTTLLKALIVFFKPTHNIRIQELIFELSLRFIYPNRNIITFREIPGVSGQDGLDLQKKTDGVINLLGEVASSSVANWVIQMSQVASLFTAFTHHANTVDDLIIWYRDALLKDGGLSNEKAAESEVVNCIHFDIHMENRRIVRITEIIPNIDGEYHNGKLYSKRNIVLYNAETKSYELQNEFSEQTKKDILKNMNVEERMEFNQFFQQVKNKEVA